MSTKQFQITFSEESLKRFEEISQQLNLSESEVINKGLKLIDLYAKTQEKNARLILEKDGNQKEIII